MNRREKFLRLSSAALITLLMCASSLLCLFRGLYASLPWYTVYAAVGAGCVACIAFGYARWSGITMAALLFAGCAVSVAYSPDLIPNLLADLRALPSRDWNALLDSVRGFVIPAAVIASVLMFAMIYERSLLAVAVFLSLAGIIAANALSEQFRIVTALPALLGILLAIASDPRLRVRAWIPALLAVAVAFLALPKQPPTLQPLTDAAQQTRNIFQDYFAFTKERIPFALYNAGYNSVRSLDGEAAYCLGGPADPNTEPVMEVVSDGNALLRGSIKSYYTGYSWNDPIEKARYLYYDVSRRKVRNLVFDINRTDGLDANAFRNTSASVRMLNEGTSTLFVFGRLNEFHLDMSVACHFNSVGEMFLSRNVAEGDFYTMSGNMPVESSALASAVESASLREDGQYQNMLALYTQLPAGVERGVYDLAREITKDAHSDYEKALAVEHYLADRYTYTLTPDYPPLERDFASYFLLTSKEGYCAYFATAMAVLLRTLDIPARYVEGYSVPQAGTQILTGMNAHAWVEVYFRGLGWVSFDPTAAAQNRSEQEPDSDDSAIAPTSSPAPTPSPSPSPTPSPAPSEENDWGSDEPTPSPAPSDGNRWDDSDEPTPNPWDDSDDSDDSDNSENRETPPPDWENDDSREHDRAWLFLLLLAILACIALCAWLIRRRLAATDPVRIADAQETQELAALALYRAMLTMLACSGQRPLSDEMPERFAQRVAPDSPFVDFARRISDNRYGNRPVTDSDIRLGFRAYNFLRRRMPSKEKFRFCVRRIFRGIGNFRQIP